MNILERLKTRFDPRIVQPDELAREAHDEIDRLRAALSGLVRVFVNPYDGGEFEAGEIPELDAARAALSQEQ